ncbi:MAG: M23 family metallopeptidase [Clostridia bacterium]|nr:M23 family metallopeptidase [Clostridia bacterium]
MFKKLLIHTRRSFKITNLIILAGIIICVIVFASYKTTYSVFINGEQVGYTNDKSDLQSRINEYIENGDGEQVAFVQVQNMPQYESCLLKRNEETNDDEIFEKVKAEGIKYYRYYSIMDGEEEKVYVKSFDEAEKIISDLKDKKSKNIDDLKIVEKYETELKDFMGEEAAVAELFVEPPKVVKVASYTSTGYVNTATTSDWGAPELGFSIIQPVSGIITSRFGARSSLRVSTHTGLDLATSSGTPIAAAASGTVTFSGWKGSYGNLIVITHENGVQTYYGHCSALYCEAGETVSQGETIAAVGSTGNSTGPHLHFEVRVDGVAYNPENYL